MTTSFSDTDLVINPKKQFDNNSTTQADITALFAHSETNSYKYIDNDTVTSSISLDSANDKENDTVNDSIEFSRLLDKMKKYGFDNTGLKTNEKLKNIQTPSSTKQKQKQFQSLNGNNHSEITPIKNPLSQSTPFQLQQLQQQLNNIKGQTQTQTQPNIQQIEKESSPLKNMVSQKISGSSSNSSSKIDKHDDSLESVNNKTSAFINEDDDDDADEEGNNQIHGIPSSVQIKDLTVQQVQNLILGLTKQQQRLNNNKNKSKNKYGNESESESESESDNEREKKTNETIKNDQKNYNEKENDTIENETDTENESLFNHSSQSSIINANTTINNGDKEDDNNLKQEIKLIDRSVHDFNGPSLIIQHQNNNNQLQDNILVDRSMQAAIFDQGTSFHLDFKDRSLQVISNDQYENQRQNIQTVSHHDVPASINITESTRIEDHKYDNDTYHEDEGSIISRGTRGERIPRPPAPVIYRHANDSMVQHYISNLPAPMPNESDYGTDADLYQTESQEQEHENDVNNGQGIQWFTDDPSHFQIRSKEPYLESVSEYEDNRRQNQAQNPTPNQQRVFQNNSVSPFDSVSMTGRPVPQIHNSEMNHHQQNDQISELLEKFNELQNNYNKTVEIHRDQVLEIEESYKQKLQQQKDIINEQSEEIERLNSQINDFSNQIENKDEILKDNELILSDKNDEIKSLETKLKDIIGIDKTSPLKSINMPDGRKFKTIKEFNNKIPKGKQIYYKLNMDIVDEKLSLIELQNILKNVLLQFGCKISKLPNRIEIISKFLLHEELLLNFINDIHKILYNGNELQMNIIKNNENKIKYEKCLKDMTIRISKIVKVVDKIYKEKYIKVAMKEKENLEKKLRELEE